MLVLYIQNLFLLFCYIHTSCYMQFEGVEINHKHLIGVFFFNLLFQSRLLSACVPMTLLVVPPGQPTVERHGPLFPALETNITLCFCTASVITSQILLKDKLTKLCDSEQHKINPHNHSHRCNTYPELGQWVASP